MEYKGAAIRGVNPSTAVTKAYIFPISSCETIEASMDRAIGEKMLLNSETTTARNGGCDQFKSLLSLLPLTNSPK